MEILLILLLGGGIAFCWSRIDSLERRVEHLSDQIIVLSHDLMKHAKAGTQADPEVAREATPPQSAPEPVPDPFAEEPAQPAVPESQAEPPFEEQSRPEQAPQEETALPEQPEPVAAAAYAKEPEPALTQEIESQSGFSFDFEDIFGRRLPIWGGGFALAIAGIFLVRFSIEAGLLTAGVRVALSFVFGLALLAGAEAAYRFEERLRDPRVRQALAGAGLATLYGAFYLAGTAYGLIGAGTAFVGLAVVTAAAIALSFRFGLPSAVIGLVGGFAAPMLVNSDSANVPLLSFYLALVTGGLVWAGHAQGRNWLGLPALAGGLGWGALMIFGGVGNSADFIAVGTYLVVLGTVLPAFLRSKGGPSLPVLASGAIATLQMAVLVSEANFAPLTWGLYLLISAALAGLGWRFSELRPGSLVAAGVGLWLLLIWSNPDPQFYALVAAAQVAIFALVPLAHQAFGRARHLDLAQLSIVALGIAIAIYTRYGGWGSPDIEPLLGGCILGLALLPALAFTILWHREEDDATRKPLLLLIPAVLLSFAALLLLTPAWLAPASGLLAAALLLWCYSQRDTLAVKIAYALSAALTIAALLLSPDFESEILRLGNITEEVDLVRALIRWLAAASPFAAMAWLGRSRVGRGFGEVLAVMLTYGAVAQIAHHLGIADALAWIAALAAIAILLRWQEERLAACATALVIAGLWAAEPLFEWVMAGSEAMIGMPFLATSAIAPVDLALRIAPLGAAFAMLVWKRENQSIEQRSAMALGLCLIAAIALHSLFKLGFNITSLLAFEHYGFGERSVWQALLLVAAYGAQKLLPADYRRPVSLTLIALTLMHFVWFSLVLHNPLLMAQHVGPTPIANWLLLAYPAAIVGIWMALSQWDDAPRFARATVDAVSMALIALLGLSLLRQVFAGSVLTSTPISQTESLLISLLGIVLALGFLWWGSWRGQRSWRIGSLVLMLGAVVKVFLIDAAGLEGLLRVASFMALGFSLIGIGWVYTKQLARRGGEDAGEVPPDQAEVSSASQS
ncbi:DUF2339 domain-containing protein [uncultured Erythrobacter sp.]|uniref:DUF2339 domain-containing protein n=1 Tax=uncultured Erythrobacter sp. TaxID=263913 RepID=UPI00262AAA82|nr:DUF2339 domain-containing protein [uncultured Erythrobacter sp.]